MRHIPHDLGSRLCQIQILCLIPFKTSSFSWMLRGRRTKLLLGFLGKNHQLSHKGLNVFNQAIATTNLDKIFFFFYTKHATSPPKNSDLSLFYPQSLYELRLSDTERHKLTDLGCNPEHPFGWHFSLVPAKVCRKHIVRHACPTETGAHRCRIQQQVAGKFQTCVLLWLLRI